MFWTPEPDPGDIRAGSLLRRARRMARLSQRDLAERAGVPCTTLARIESGETKDPRVRTLAALLAAADCRLAVIALEDDRELPADLPWEDESDHGGRHFPAHLDLWPVRRFHESRWWGDWWGWHSKDRRARDDRIPRLTFARRPRGAGRRAASDG